MSDRPDIVLVLADDMGFSDIGCYGGEIETPNIDRLAADGVRLTQFYNTARCSPSRASLMTGLHPHQVGVGILNFDDTPDGYPGDLTEECVTVARGARCGRLRDVPLRQVAPRPPTWRRRTRAGPRGAGSTGSSARSRARAASTGHAR